MTIFAILLLTNSLINDEFITNSVSESSPPVSESSPPSVSELLPSVSESQTYQTVTSYITSSSQSVTNTVTNVNYFHWSDYGIAIPIIIGFIIVGILFAVIFICIKKRCPSCIPCIIC